MITHEYINLNNDMAALERLSGGTLTREVLADMLSQRNVNGFVILLNKKVVGYYLVHLSVQTIRVFHLAIEDSQVINHLISLLKAKLGKGRRTRLLMQVRETDLALQLALKSEGFRAVKIIEEEGVTYYLFKYEEKDMLQVSMDKGFMAEID